MNYAETAQVCLSLMSVRQPPSLMKNRSIQPFMVENERRECNRSVVLSRRSPADAGFAACVNVMDAIAPTLERKLFPFVSILPRAAYHGLGVKSP